MTSKMDKFRERTADRKLADRSMIARLYVKGHTFNYIASQTGLNISTVMKDMEYLREQWKKQAVYDYNVRIAIELNKLDLIEAEAWGAWERSQRYSEKSSTFRRKKRDKDSEQNSIGNGEDLEEIERVITEEGRSGDAAYLDIVRSCIDRRCKLLGLDAPIKIAPVKLNEDGEWKPSDEDKRELLKFAFARAGIDNKLLENEKDKPSSSYIVDANGNTIQPNTEPE